jgi:DNA-binding PadR family transcriptional regulator
MRINIHRLLALGMLDGWGVMHTYDIQRAVRRTHLESWTGIRTGSLYYTLHRLVDEGLVASLGVTREGNRPMREIFEITDAGRAAFAELLREAMDTPADYERPDPFDVALCVAGADAAQRLDTVVETRVRRLEADLAELRQAEEQLAETPNAPVTARAILRHLQSRRESEIRWHQELREMVPGLAAEAAQRSGDTTLAHAAQT